MYVEQNLRPNEEIVLKAKKSPFLLVKSFLIMAVCVAVAVVVLVADESSEVLKAVANLPTQVKLLIGSLLIITGAAFFILDLLRLCFMCLAITNKRVIGKAGLFNKSIIDYPIEKVNNIVLKSSFWGMIFKFQTISVTGANDTNKIKFCGISNANQFKNSVTDAIEQYKLEARRNQAEEIAMALRGNDK